ncbi:hypothetical protein PoB_002875000 [Plakobranchus ocellatus]|uniref:Uncharacterized protein n=1 Tax=Plakobranchus ocellatus TaxID=259542 RepID=A0AAV4A259_9GAST|nr:hypothetical protein PoB_002875000 [Plakobranchus ocellatus]
MEEVHSKEEKRADLAQEVAGSNGRCPAIKGPWKLGWEECGRLQCKNRGKLVPRHYERCRTIPDVTIKEKPSPQQSDLRFEGPPSGRHADGWARTRDRRVTVDLGAESLATVLSTPPAQETITIKQLKHNHPRK